jgi:hypothetical protein
VTRAVAARRAVSAAAWGVVALMVAALAVALTLADRSAAVIGSKPPELVDLVWASPFVAFAIVGAVIVSRRPRNGVGWLLCAIGLCLTVGIAADEYAKYGLLTAPGAVPAPQVGLTLGVLLLVSLPLIALLVLVFPDGRLPSPRWRLLTGVGLAAFAAMLLMELIPPQVELGEDLFLPNPLAVPGLHAAMDRLAPVVTAGMVLFAALAVAAPVVRFRRSRGVERLQLKWVAVAVLMVPLALLVTVGLESVGVLGEDGAVLLGWGLPGVGVAVSIAMAVLRYRLYDIDRVVSRTMTYGLLTAVLGAAYAGGVVVLSQLFAPVAQSSELAVAASTLLVAALFGPLRRQVQRLVDRRFNRSRYDAERTVAGFARGLRAEVDLAQVERDLLAAVHASVEPERAQLWLIAGTER